MVGPNFGDIAKAYDLDYMQVSKKEDIKKAFE